MEQEINPTFYGKSYSINLGLNGNCDFPIPMYGRTLSHFQSNDGSCDNKPWNIDPNIKLTLTTKST